jgi:hypothetical protein
VAIAIFSSLAVRFEGKFGWECFVRYYCCHFGQKNLWVYPGGTPFASLINQAAKLMSG